MSKVESYRCDYCGQIKDSENIVGISLVEDIFDRLLSFPIIKHNTNAEVHGCTDCYNYCMTEASSINRRKYEQLYIDKRKEAGYNFRKQCVFNFIEKKYTPPRLTKFEKEKLKL